MSGKRRRPDQTRSSITSNKPKRSAVIHGCRSNDARTAARYYRSHKAGLYPHCVIDIGETIELVKHDQIAAFQPLSRSTYHVVCTLQRNDWTKMLGNGDAPTFVYRIASQIAAIDAATGNSIGVDDISVADGDHGFVNFPLEMLKDCYRRITAPQGRGLHHFIAESAACYLNPGMISSALLKNTSESNYQRLGAWLLEALDPETLAKISYTRMTGELMGDTDLETWVGVIEDVGATEALTMMAEDQAWIHTNPTPVDMCLFQIQHGGIPLN